MSKFSISAVISVITLLFSSLNVAAQSQADRSLLELLQISSDSVAAPEDPAEEVLDMIFADFIFDGDTMLVERPFVPLELIPSSPLPVIAFMPAVFDSIAIMAPYDVTSSDGILASGNPDLDWIREVSDSRARYRSLKQRYLLENMPDVRYNLYHLPAPPKQYQAIVDPATKRITVNEIVIAMDSTHKNTEIAAVDFGRKNWLHTFKSSLQFSQAFVSPNWYQGGNNNVNVLGNVNWNVKLNDKFHPNWIVEATTQYKVGVTNAPNDEVHSYLINQDLFQFNGTLGLKAIQHWYYSLTATFKTQLFDNYKQNSRDLKAAFLSPAELNLGLGMTYNYVNKPRRFKMDMSVAPLSYNMKMVADSRLDVTKFGISEGHKSVSEIGSNAEVKVTWDIMWNISYASRFFIFSDYSYIQSDWENTLNLSINRYLSTQLFVHMRYDSSRPTTSKDWGRFQLREVLSFGLQYQFKTI